MKCPVCGKENLEGFKFCIACGSGLPQATIPTHETVPLAETPPAPQPEPAAIPSPVVPAAAAVPPPPAPQAAAVPPSPPSAASYPAAAQAAVPPQPAPPPLPASNYAYAQPAPLPPSPAAPASATFELWGPFAGAGKAAHHQTWYLPGAATQAETLRQTIDASLANALPPGVLLERTQLSAPAVIPAHRPYSQLKRNDAMAALGIAEAGPDLAISLVSYVKPPISWGRVIIFGVLALLELIYLISYTNVLGNALEGALGNSLFGNGSGFQGLANLLCVAGPLGGLLAIALVVFLVLSLYKLLVDKDILAYLRLPVNEFNQESRRGLVHQLMSALHSALDDAGLDSDKLRAAE